MSMLKPPKSATTNRPDVQADALTSAYATSWSLWDQYRTLIIGIGVAVVVIGLATFAYINWSTGKDEEAAKLLGGALTAYEAGDFAVALEGTVDEPGLLAIADDYGATPTGNLAAFYAADALMQLERYDEALTYFDRYDAEDDIIGASALAGEAAIYEQQGDAGQAARLYRRAADMYEGVSAPDYLLAAARNYEALGDFDAAARVYDAIEAQYDESSAAANLGFYRARLDAMR
ncbi:MAG: tetratricopeptide repeat protein [Bacteroidota bacterium]